MKLYGFIIPILLIYFIPKAFFAEDISNYSNNYTNKITKNALNISALYGEMSINSNNFNTIRLLPEINFWIISLGLQLNYDFDTNGNFRTTEWNSWRAILFKIQYLSLGSSQDPVFIKLGDIDEFSLGDGFIFNRYSDKLNYPDVNMLGLAFDLNFGYFGLESMAENVILWDILGIRAYIKPFIDINDSIFSNLEIGFTFGADLNNQDQFPPADNPYLFTYNTNSQGKVVIYGADIGTFLVDISDFSLKGFADIAAIQNEGSGEMVGISGIIVQTVPYSLALRILQPDFLPSYFDTFYEVTRSYKYESLGVLSNNSLGWVGSTGIILVSNKLSLNFQYEGYFSDEINPSLLVTFELSKDLLKLIGLKLSFLRQNFNGFDDLFANTNGNISTIVTIDFYVSDNIKLSINVEGNYESSENQNYSYIYTFVNTLIKF